MANEISNSRKTWIIISSFPNADIWFIRAIFSSVNTFKVLSAVPDIREALIVWNLERMQFLGTNLFSRGKNCSRLLSWFDHFIGLACKDRAHLGCYFRITLVIKRERLLHERKKETSISLLREPRSPNPFVYQFDRKGNFSVCLRWKNGAASPYLQPKGTSPVFLITP